MKIISMEKKGIMFNSGEVAKRMVKTRICNKCNKELPETEEFFQKGSNQSGKKWLYPTCKDCQYPKRKWRICSKCRRKKEPSKYITNSKICNDCKKVGGIVKKKTSPPKIRKNKKDKILIEQSLNGLNGDLKAVERYKKLSEEIIVLMRKNRIKKYGINAQKLILELMNACYKHLQKEMNDKEVISVEWE